MSKKDSIQKYGVKKSKSNNTKISKKKNGARKIYTDDGEIEVNGYYWTVARSMTYAKYSVIILMLGIIILGIGLNSKEFSLENLSYLLRYIDIQTTKKIITQELVIEVEEDSEINFYKNNFVVMNKEKLEIYDSDGRRNFTQQSVYSRPALAVSNKYILTYDIGAPKMEVFNSFSCLYSYKGQQPIYMAKMNEEGNIAYVSSELGYRSVVNIKDVDFNNDFFSWKSDKFVVDIDISQNADKLVVATFDGKGGNYESSITTFDTSYDENYKTRINWEGILPYYVKCHSKGFYVVFEDSVKFFDMDDKLISEFSFNYKRLLHIDIDGDKLAVVLSETALGNENHIYILSNQGQILYDNSLRAEVLDIKFDETYQNLFILSLNELYRVNVETEYKKDEEIEMINEEIEKTANKILYADTEDILISGINKVSVIELE